MELTEKTDDLRGFFFIQTRAEKDFDPLDFQMFEGGIHERNVGTHDDARTYFETVFVSGQEDITGRDPRNPGRATKTVKYLYHDQQFSTFPNWNICNAILICSSDLPINGEYYPVFQTRDGFLTHYKEP